MKGPCTKAEAPAWDVMGEGLPPLTLELSQPEFEKLSALVYAKSGINLHQGKKELVRARLGKRLRATGIQTFRDYYELLVSEDGGGELVRMLDAITTNQTSFFREKAHFDFLEQTVLPSYLSRSNGSGKRSLRCWSAGCSSGEEPYSLAMCLFEYFGHPLPLELHILATDISTRILESAGRGIYSAAKVNGIAPAVLRKYFQKGFGRSEGYYRAKDLLRSAVTFELRNLMEPFTFSSPFDLILCRNVMIYFDKRTQQSLVSRFHGSLCSGGHLFIGHSESLTGIDHRFRYVRPSVYRKA